MENQTVPGLHLEVSVASKGKGTLDSIIREQDMGESLPSTRQQLKGPEPLQQTRLCAGLEK